MICRKKTGAFTLIELMIVLAIISILVAVAYPSYQEHVQKTRRSEAQGNMLELASYLERYFTENSSYTGAVLPFNQSPKTGTAFYTFTLTTVAGPPSQYTLTATPQSGQASDGCGTMSLTHTGVRSHTGSESNCW